MNDSLTLVRLHLLQLASCDGYPLQSLAELRRLTQDLRSEPGDYLLCPEMWPGSLLPEEHQRQRIENALCFAALKKIARERRCYLSGSMLEMPQRKAYNSAYLIGPAGELLGHYRKINLFRLGEEHERFSPGQRLKLISLAWGKLGLAICFDLRFPALFQRLQEQGAQVIFVPSAWPKARLEHFHTLLRARAIENQCFVIGINKVGPSRHGDYGGGSVVFGPWGENLGQMGEEAGVLRVELDLKRVEEIRRTYPFLKAKGRAKD